MAIALFGMTAPAAWGAGGTPYAWGYNSYSQLGDGTTTERHSPAPIAGLSGGVTALAGGGAHGLAIQNGKAWAWGENGTGQLGDGTTTLRRVPVPVSGLSSGVTALSGGAGHSLAIKDGGAWAWGSNRYGQLGDGTTTQHSSPAPVSGLNSHVTAIAAGAFHSLAVKDGGIWAWGDNRYGEVGDATLTQRSAPVPVSGLASGVTAIAAGAYHNLAIKDGGVWAWGLNNYGQLGDGAPTWTNPFGLSTPVPVSGLSSGVTAIAAGTNHSLAVKDGGVWAWGYNADGEVGDGSVLIRSTPVHIDPVDLTNIVDVAADDYNSYALAADGSLWVWGYNNFGQLGLGNTTRYLTPQHLLPPSGYVYTSVDAGIGAFVLATVAPVPEPGTLGVVALGLGGLWWGRRRRGR